MMYKNTPPYSVLMSVYHKENADYLRAAMESIFLQSYQPDDFVLVCDGPLNDPLYDVIEEMQKKHGDVLQVVRLEKNVGLGKALNVGMTHCRNEIIARMDSDDYSLPERCERQLDIICNYNVDIVSAIVQEYDCKLEIPGMRRTVPEAHEDIVKFAKVRNPFNHPCVMYKKSAVESVGGYQDFYLLEDYYLWIRMLMNDSKGRNIQDTLLKMRAGDGIYMRRSGLRYAISQCRLLRYMNRRGFVGLRRMIVGMISRCVLAIIPNSFRKAIYAWKLRDTQCCVD